MNGFQVLSWVAFDIPLILSQSAGNFLFFFRIFLVECHEESLVPDRFLQYKDWGSSKGAAPNTPEGWGWRAGRWWGEMRGRGVREHCYLLVDWQASFHETNYLQWRVCVCVCMCVELPQVSHPLILYCRGRSCLMEHSHLDSPSPSFSSCFSIPTYPHSHLLLSFEYIFLLFVYPCVGDSEIRYLCLMALLAVQCAECILFIYISGKKKKLGILFLLNDDGY